MPVINLTKDIGYLCGKKYKMLLVDKKKELDEWNTMIIEFINTITVKTAEYF